MKAKAVNPIQVRPETRAKFEEFAARRRMKLVDVADVAIDALNALPADLREAVIERREQPSATAVSAA